jgi:hypothetical protein
MFTVDIEDKMRFFLQIKLRRTEDVAQFTALALQAGPGLNQQHKKQISNQKNAEQKQGLQPSPDCPCASVALRVFPPPSLLSSSFLNG